MKIEMNKNSLDLTTCLENDFIFEDIDEKYLEITTSFLDNDNDNIQVYIHVEDNTVYLTNDAYTLSNLFFANDTTNLSKENIQRILNEYDISLKGDELICKSSLKDFPQRLNKFIQGIIKICSYC